MGGEVAGMWISHVGDLLIPCADSFNAYLPGKLGSGYGVKVFWENEAIY